MGIFQINLYAQHAPSNSKAMDRLASAMPDVLQAQGYEPVDAEGLVGRVVTLSKIAGTRWIEIADEQFDTNPAAAAEFARALSKASRMPVLGVVIYDSHLADCFLCDKGRVFDRKGNVDEARKHGAPPSAQAIAAWKRILGLSALSVSSFRTKQFLGLVRSSLPAVEFGRRNSDRDAPGAVRLTFGRRGGPVIRPQPDVATGSTEHRILIPEFLCSERSTVVRRLRSLFKAAFEAGSWEPVMRDVPMVAIDQVPGPIVFRGPMWPGARAYVMVDTHDRSPWMDVCSAPDFTRRWVRLTLQGMQFGWFCLILLADQVSMLPRSWVGEMTRGDAFAALQRLLNWWNALCELEPRFRAATMQQRWPMWMDSVVPLGRVLGMKNREFRELHGLTNLEAGEWLRRWLREAGSPRSKRLR